MGRAEWLPRFFYYFCFISVKAQRRESDRYPSPPLPVSIFPHCAVPFSSDPSFRHPSAFVLNNYGLCFFG
ncbi:hypothetical protein DTO166G4_58 [Paecilomyces variotii]|nr:hypothetical protein DTO166G4_58 [Paecilomyces variotii]KAJ9219395.1 hypothetical protein DTO169C6_8287 [Paecilomyces variotii]KAJ9239844.1 hypothetical protein DTO166G5_2111 [Paecilomyces variotii]KAJ9269959.1 hypothetical protein DTO212C5_3929 [Paecilomyces variotii]KAJ9284637.1 hypothetical protein DTO021C3_7764 [Paecilomyces variotii]